MNRRLLKKIAIWVASIMVVIIIGAYYAMNYATNRVLHILATAEQSTEVSSDLPQSSVTTLPSVTPHSNNGSSDVPTTLPTADPNSSADPHSTAASNPNATKSPTPGPTKYVAEISTEKAQDATKQISLKDKTEVSLILLKKLSPSDITLLAKMSGGGLTIDEKKAAKKIISQKLTESEYDQLIQIAAKLGLSQGKDYEQSLKEYPVN